LNSLLLNGISKSKFFFNKAPVVKLIITVKKDFNVLLFI